MKRASQSGSIALSIGDSNGVGCEILLRKLGWLLYQCGQISSQEAGLQGGESSLDSSDHVPHTRIHGYTPIICAHRSLLESALALLESKGALKPSTARQIHSLLSLLEFAPPSLTPPPIRIGEVCAESGAYSFASVERAVELASSSPATAVLTLPIHKGAWKQAGIPHAGHTEYLRARFQRDVLMVLGCEAMRVALFCDHIPLSQVSARISVEAYQRFLLTLARHLPFSQALVLGFNPHCGDSGAIGGKEDTRIQAALESTNALLGREAFLGVCPSDTAFTPRNRSLYKVFVAPYHDVGLAPLKALYFDESINISLNLPIIRTSVDHGVAFDIAYRGSVSTKSFQEAVRFTLAQLARSQALV